ncbi:MAG: hypothetical protein KGJ62_14065 [Armatimonadetes bacterium]|nr:hypothetical protein [Armatimonadota bacterium]MDE2207015.1 hypothetical protein [Armatimonadota bacterium]
MSIAQIAKIVQLGVLTLQAIALMLGLLASRRLRAPRRAAGVTALTLLVVLAAASWPLRARVGPVASWEASLIAGAVGAFFAAGIALPRRKAPAAAALILGVACLGGTAVLNGKIVSLANRIGIAGGAVSYKPEVNKSCIQNLHSLYLAFSMYAQDYDALPPAAGWLQNPDLVSKVRENTWLHCPAVSNRHDDKYGYAMNDAVSGMPMHGRDLKQTPHAAETALVYDSSNLAISAHDRFSSLPSPGRHAGKDNVLYMDGHVAAVAPH